MMIGSMIGKDNIKKLIP